MTDIDYDIELATRFCIPVLITADCRVQRETRARLIHANGRPRRSPFVTCPVEVSITGSQARPASPTALADAVGLRLRRHFAQARGGTLFIDDVATLPQDAQAQLCRLLEAHSVARAHAPRTHDGSVRIIAGASRHLDAERTSGAFCEQLFYRLNVVHIDLLSSSACGTRASDSSHVGMK